VVVLRGAVAAHVEHLEPHPVAVAAAVAVVGGKVAVDAAPDLGPFGAHTDGLGNRHRGVGEHLDVAVKRKDLLARLHGAGREQEQPQNKAHRHGQLPSGSK